MADDAEGDSAREVLERVLTNDRATCQPSPSVASSWHRCAPLAAISERRLAEDALVSARRLLEYAKQRGEPHLRQLRQAEADLNAAEADLRANRVYLADAPLLRRRRATQRTAQATTVVGDSRARRDAAADAAAPYHSEIDAAEAHVREAGKTLSSARIRERLDGLTLASGPEH